jgi:hypothetical protein
MLLLLLATLLALPFCTTIATCVVFSHCRCLHYFFTLLLLIMLCSHIAMLFALFSRTSIVFSTRTTFLHCLCCSHYFFEVRLFFFLGCRCYHCCHCCFSCATFSHCHFSHVAPLMFLFSLCYSFPTTLFALSILLCYFFGTIIPIMLLFLHCHSFCIVVPLTLLFLHYLSSCISSIY